MLLNEITFAGNLGADAELRHTQNGTQIVSFPLAHTEKGKDGRADTTTWVRVLVFGNWCEYASQFRKGDNVAVRGKLSVRKYQANDGTERIAVEILAYSIGKIEKASRYDQAPQQQRQQQPQQQRQQPARSDQSFGSYDTPGLDDIPF